MEEKRFKNEQMDIGKDVISRFNDKGAWQADYQRSEWDVEVILTRKVKPIPNGFIAISKTGALYFKQQDVLRYVSTMHICPEVKISGNTDESMHALISAGRITVLREGNC